jgi:hypothetical protein
MFPGHAVLNCFTHDGEDRRPTRNVATKEGVKIRSPAGDGVGETANANSRSFSDGDGAVHGDREHLLEKCILADQRGDEVGEGVCGILPLREPPLDPERLLDSRAHARPHHRRMRCDSREKRIDQRLADRSGLGQRSEKMNEM